ncbi:MAG: methyltransferase domain-containing protein [Dokdonella sp.]|nr:methyltransferase domain-containing protein [Dokdonella sp.]
MYEDLLAFQQRPQPFSRYTAAIIWTDPHISAQMLRHHLDPNTDSASRNAAKIAQTIAWLERRFRLAGKQVCDLGCGPGLYAEPMARHGARVTGVDFSARSIAHARASAQTHGLAIDYQQSDFLLGNLPGEQDLVCLIYGEYCTLSPVQRTALLARVRNTLRPGGQLVLDVFTRAQFATLHEGSTCAQRLMDGFWSANDYFGFHKSFVYAQEQILLDRYLILEAERKLEIYNWLQFFDAPAICAELAAAGFEIESLLDAVSGEPWDAGPHELAVVARRPAPRPSAPLAGITRVQQKLPNLATPAPSATEPATPPSGQSALAAVTERFRLRLAAHGARLAQGSRSASSSTVRKPTAAAARMIEFGHSTHVGLRREHNEDTYHADTDLGLWLVADGMGGHEHGEVASALARDTLIREVRNGTTLVQAIQLADEEIIRHSTRRSEALPMGTTIAALRLTSDTSYEIAWVGDSRIYLWDSGALRQISQDHSYVQELIDQGAITSEQARNHPHRNVVTQALGVTDPQSLRVESVRGDFKPGMQLLLCSDGLTEEVDDSAIAQILARNELSAQECVEHLILAALEGGGSDNVTVLLVRRT